MSSHHELFLKAIQEKKIVALTFNSIEKGIIVRKCICYDYAISKRYKDGNYRYHFHDLDSPDGKHTLSILPEQLIAIEISTQTFEPGDYVTWTPTWSVKRDWGMYS